jgi:cell division septal protein FtsQ
LIDFKSSAHPWGSLLSLVALRGLVGFFFFGVAVVFVWVVLILFFQEKVPASGSAQTLSPRDTTRERVAQNRDLILWW